MVKCFNPYSPGFSIYLKNMNIYEKLSDGFNPYSPGFSIYLIDREVYMLCLEKLQSLFTWIFYLFFKSASLLAFFLGCFNPYSPGFSIYFEKIYFLESNKNGFNPYSPGFSIYFFSQSFLDICCQLLQSLFTWIFYLFCRTKNRK